MLVAGADLGGLTTACRLARVLSPATVVLEDVDLVAEERTMFGHGQNSMIAALLNEMDAVDKPMSCSSSRQIALICLSLRRDRGVRERTDAAGNRAGHTRRP